MLPTTPHNRAYIVNLESNEGFDRVLVALTPEADPIDDIINRWNELFNDRVYSNPEEIDVRKALYMRGEDDTMLFKDWRILDNYKIHSLVLKRG